MPIDRYRGTLVGVAVGDALGAPVEGRRSTAAYVATLDSAGGDLAYTDDTAMTIALAESLLEVGGFDGHHLAHTFARHFAAEPWRGYGAGPPEIFGKLERGMPWDRAASSLFGGRGSFGNGAAMRVAPVALFAHPDREAAAELARNSAIVTHTNPEGVDGAVALAVAISLVLGLGPGETVDPQKLLDEIRPHLTTGIFRDKLAYLGASVENQDLADLARVLGNGIAAHTSVPTAIACFLTHPTSLSRAIKSAIGLGGDTDTIAAMTGALAGAHLGLAAVPQPWRRVEGYHTLIDLADRLYAHSITL